VEASCEKKSAPHPSRDDDQEIKKRNLATAESESGFFFKAKTKKLVQFFLSLLSFSFPTNNDDSGIEQQGQC
jgi:hypothetical protein